MADCQICGAPLVSSDQTCPNCVAKTRSADSEALTNSVPSEAPVGPPVRPAAETRGAAVQTIWSQRFAEVGIVFGLVGSLLLALFIIGDSLIVMFSDNEFRAREAEMTLVGGIILLVVSPLAGAFAGIAFGVIGMTLQGITYYATGRFRCVPHAEAIIDRFEDDVEKAMYGDEREWQVDPAPGDERVQRAPGTDAESVREE